MHAYILEVSPAMLLTMTAPDLYRSSGLAITPGGERVAVDLSAVVESTYDLARDLFVMRVLNPELKQDVRLWWEFTLIDSPRPTHEEHPSVDPATA